MSAPTPRTDAAWSASFEGKQLSAGQTARALRECSQQLERELATLTAERDELRSEVERLRSDRDCEKRLRKDAEEFREDAIERAMKAEAELAEMHKSFAGNVHTENRVLQAELATEREKAERYRLTTLKLDAELADQTTRFHDEIVRRQGTVRANHELNLKERDHLLDLLAIERARLDWFHEAASDRIWLVGQDIRAAIDAAMKEAAK